MAVSAAVLAFVQRCQCVAGVWLEGDTASRWAAVWTCLRAVPPAASRSDRGAVTAVLLRLASLVLPELEVEALRAPSWGTGPGRTARRARVNAALRVLGGRYAEPGLTLQGVAEAVGVSYWYLSRAIRGETGLSWVTHLHGLRLLKAVALLRTTALTVKEVAVAVGYWPTSELDAYFHRWLAVKPSALRAATVPWVSPPFDDTVGGRVRQEVRRRPGNRAVRHDLGQPAG